jgi:hypothetical protein
LGNGQSLAHRIGRRKPTNVIHHSDRGGFASIKAFVSKSWRLSQKAGVCLKKALRVKSLAVAKKPPGNDKMDSLPTSGPGRLSKAAWATDSDS